MIKNKRTKKRVVTTSPKPILESSPSSPRNFESNPKEPIEKSVVELAAKSEMIKIEKEKPKKRMVTFEMDESDFEILSQKAKSDERTVSSLLRFLFRQYVSKG